MPDRVSNEVIVERINNLQSEVRAGFAEQKAKVTDYDTRLRAAETFIAGLIQSEKTAPTGKDWVKIVLAALGIISTAIVLLGKGM